MTCSATCSISLVSLNMLDIVTSKVLDNPVTSTVLCVKMLDDFELVFYLFLKYVSLPFFSVVLMTFFKKTKLKGIVLAAWMLLLAWPVGLGQSYFLDVFLTCLPIQSLFHTLHVYGTQQTRSWVWSLHLSLQKG